MTRALSPDPGGRERALLSKKNLVFMSDREDSRFSAEFPFRRRLASVRQAACVQVGQVQSWQLHETQESLQCSHEQTLWLQVGQLQSSHVQVAQWSEQCGQLQMSHSS